MPPTPKDIFNEELGDYVSQELSSWRHGNHVVEVYKRDNDNTYWRVTYQSTPDGEYNGLRDGAAIIEEVWPVEVLITKYVTKRP